MRFLSLSFFVWVNDPFSLFFCWFLWCGFCGFLLCLRVSSLTSRFFLQCFNFFFLLFLCHWSFRRFTYGNLVTTFASSKHKRWMIFPQSQSLEIMVLPFHIYCSIGSSDGRCVQGAGTQSIQAVDLHLRGIPRSKRIIPSVCPRLDELCDQILLPFDSFFKQSSSFTKVNDRLSLSIIVARVQPKPSEGITDLLSLHSSYSFLLCPSGITSPFIMWWKEHLSHWNLVRYRDWPDRSLHQLRTAMHHPPSDPLKGLLVCQSSECLGLVSFSVLSQIKPQAPRLVVPLRQFL